MEGVRTHTHTHIGLEQNWKSSSIHVDDVFLHEMKYELKKLYLFHIC